jgi:hypothetical protein
MGLLNSLGVNNGFTDFLNQHRGALMQAGVGFANGDTPSSGIGLATQGLARGAVQDDAYATQQKEAADRQAQITATQKALAKYPDLAALAVPGADMGPIISELFRRESPGYGDPSYGKPPVDPADTATGRQTLADQQGLTGKARAEYILTGKLPEPGSASVPSGYRPTEDGTGLEPIPGGPADPSTTQMLSPEALDLVATQYLAGDKSAAVGYARNATLKAQITNAIAAKAKEMGMDGKGVAAEISAYGGNVAAQRSAGTRAAQVGMAASEANQMADIALNASKAVPRGSFVPWNAAMNAVATGTSSPEMAQFVTATTSLVNAYARAVSPLGAPTDAMRAHAEQMLNTAQGPEAYAAVIAQMKKEMEAALNAPAEISKNLKESVAGGGDQGAVDYKQKYGLD